MDDNNSLKDRVTQLEALLQRAAAMSAGAGLQAGLEVEGASVRCALPMGDGAEVSVYLQLPKHAAASPATLQAAIAARR